MVLFIKKHIGLFLFQIVILILLLGVISESGVKHIDKILYVEISLILCYFFLLKTKWLVNFVKNNLISTVVYNSNKLNKVLFYLCIALFVLDLLILRGLPGFKVFFIENTKEYTELRKNIHLNTFVLFKYLSSINIHAVLPFTILHFLILNNKRISYFLLILSCVYAFGLMQKSFIIVIVIPSLIYFISKRKFLNASILSSIIIFVVFSLTWPTLTLKNVDTPSEPNIELTENSGFFDNLKNSVIGLSKRVFFLPGEMVSNWFEIIPSKKPYLMGDGYPFYTALRGRTYINYELELYPMIYPKYAKLGYAGSVNCATFVREYSNFGYLGLLLSGVLLGITFHVLRIIFESQPILFLSLNLFPILLLSSGNLFTLMFSGGWAFSILLFYLYKNQYINKF